jgi:hypothetical protein
MYIIFMWHSDQKLHTMSHYMYQNIFLFLNYTNTIKGQVVPVHTMKACWESSCTAALILNLSTRVRWTVSLTMATSLPESPLTTHSIGWLVGPKTRLDILVKKLIPCQDSYTKTVHLVVFVTTTGLFLLPTWTLYPHTNIITALT